MLSFPLGYYLKVDLLGQFTWKIIHQTFFKFDQNKKTSEAQIEQDSANKTM